MQAVGWRLWAGRIKSGVESGEVEMIHILPPLISGARPQARQRSYDPTGEGETCVGGNGVDQKCVRTWLQPCHLIVTQMFSM